MQKYEDELSPKLMEKIIYYHVKDLSARIGMQPINLSGLKMIAMNIYEKGFFDQALLTLKTTCAACAYEGLRNFSYTISYEDINESLKISKKTLAHRTSILRKKISENDNNGGKRLTYDISNSLNVEAVILREQLLADNATKEKNTETKYLIYDIADCVFRNIGIPQYYVKKSGIKEMLGKAYENGMFRLCLTWARSLMVACLYIDLCRRYKTHPSMKTLSEDTGVHKHSIFRLTKEIKQKININLVP